MPTIQNFEQTKGLLPESPAAVDINPERFGKDTAAMAEIGGTIGDFGSKLMQVRKQAMESDAVAAAKSDATLKISAFEEEARMGFQDQVLSNGAVASPQGSMAESVKVKMEKLMEEQIKAMPTGDAQREYANRMQPFVNERYVYNLDWENKERAKSYGLNIDKRAGIATQDIYKRPNVMSTMNHLSDLQKDIAAKTGSVIDKNDAGKLYQTIGKKYVTSMMEGLAESENPDDIKKGRMLMKDMPPQLAELLEQKDLEAFENKFDAAEKQFKIQQEYNEGLQKKAKKEEQDRVQDAVLSDIYEGKATVRDIISGKGKLLDPDKKQQMIGVLKARLNEPQIPNPLAMRNVVKRMTLEDGDPNRITNQNQILDMYVNGQLTWDQKNQATNQLKQLQSDSGQVEVTQKKNLFKYADNILAKEGPTGFADPDGALNSAQFMQYVNDEVEAAKKRGEDIRPLLDPNNPNSFYKKVDAYRKSPQQIQKALVDRMKNQKAAANGVKAVQPKGTVRVLNPSGKAGFVPEKDIDGFLSRGYKLAPADGKKKSNREPSSVADIEGLDIDTRMSQLLVKLHETADDGASRKLLDEYDRIKNAAFMEDIDSVIDSGSGAPGELEEYLSKEITDTENVIAEFDHKEQRFHKMWANDRLDFLKNKLEDITVKAKQENGGSASGKLPTLKRRKPTKAEEEFDKNNPGDWGKIRK